MASVRTSIPPDFVQQRRETGSGAISMRLAVEIWIAFIDIINKYEKTKETLMCSPQISSRYRDPHISKRTLSSLTALRNQKSLK